MSTDSTSGVTASAVELADRHGRELVASRSDYLFTYATSCLTTICGIAAFRLAHESFGPDGFAEYALTRRSIAFLVPLFSLGLAVAIPKFVACHASKHRAASIRFLGGGLLLTAASMAVFLVIACVLPGPTSFLCIGDSHRQQLVLSLVPLVFGMILTASTSAYCRGRMWFHASNAIQFVCTGMITTVGLLFFSDVETFLSGTGLAVCVVNAVIVAMLLCTRSQWIDRRWHFAAARSLLRFGAPRVPGDLAYYGLLAAPAIAAAQQAGVRIGGEIAYALTWIMLLSQLVAPLSMLLLPEASYLLQTGRPRALRRRMVKLLAFSLGVTCVAVGVLIYLAPTLLALHLGSHTPTLLHHVRALLVGAIPLNVFICVRSAIDAGEMRAVSPALCIGALAIFGLVLLPSHGHGQAAGAAIVAFNIAVSALAVSACVATYFVLEKHEAAAARGDVTRTWNELVIE
jgi:O-antigen/teichoic acid export membrane protein